MANSKTCTYYYYFEGEVEGKEEGRGRERASERARERDGEGDGGTSKYATEEIEGCLTVVLFLTIKSSLKQDNFVSIIYNTASIKKKYSLVNLALHESDSKSK